MDIVVTVKKIKSCFFLSWILVGILVTVTIATSFSLCNDGARTGRSTMLSTSSTVAQDFFHSDSQTSKDTSDPCTMGFCHLGHCSNVLAPTISYVNLSLDFTQDFNSIYQSLLDRFLDGPFQPPKIA